MYYLFLKQKDLHINDKMKALMPANALMVASIIFHQLIRLSCIFDYSHAQLMRFDSADAAFKR